MPELFYRLYYLYVIIQGLSIRRLIRKYMPVLFIILLTIASFRLLSIYLISDFNLWLCILLAPFIIYFQNPGRQSYRFGILALFTLGLYYFIPVLTLYYLCFSFALLFAIESFYGKLNNASILVIIVTGSITRYFINLFSFSIRMKLSSWAAYVLKLIGIDAISHGNIIEIGERSFAVDQECMGLKMVVTTLMIALVILSFFERRNNKRLKWHGWMVLALVTSALIFLNNFMRILALVIMKSAPGTFSHEVIGITGFILLNVIPLYLVIPFILELQGKLKQRLDESRKTSPIIRTSILVILIAGLAGFNITYKAMKAETDPFIENLLIPGYNKELNENNIAKFTSDSSLVYIKPPAPFYGSDHNPYICWQGSGYEFSEINSTAIESTEVFTAKLTKGNNTLYTAWWFSNGEYSTIDQVEWRIKTMKGHSPFRMVNVTCENRDDLVIQCSKLMKKI